MAVLDPGMANIRTEAEAAGTPMTPEMIELARNTERMQNPPSGDPDACASARTGPRLLIALLAAVMPGIAAAILGMR